MQRVVMESAHAICSRRCPPCEQVERYIYFPADAVRLRTGSCLLERDREESADSGQLAICLRRIQELHAKFYGGELIFSVD